MTRIVPVVDLFSGPGGLAEGFAAFRGPADRRRFSVALSIENDRDAHRTLQLRAFLRTFGTDFPPEYYEFLNGTLTEEPDWEARYPGRWATARYETQCLELGTSGASNFLRQRLERLQEEHRGRTVLLGGPPCQSYSVIGRSRNVRNSKYDARKDKRLSLYRQYARALAWLRPAVAVMENVKGILSAKRNERPIFPLVLRTLRHAGGTDSYRLFALVAASGDSHWDEGRDPGDFLVHAEDHGVPQSRHRVFVICVRSDLAETLPEKSFPRLESADRIVPVNDVIGVMPKLRSRLSRGDDSGAWQDAVREACDLVEGHQRIMTPDEQKRFRRALHSARTAADGAALPWRDARGRTALPARCPPELRDWLFDGEIERLPNNETRAHMPSDLARYLFAATFARTFGRSPKRHDFPSAFAPNHVSWHTDNFDDRFRVQVANQPGTTVTSHIAKDGHYFIHPEPRQCRSLTVREVARLQTFPDNYFFHGSRSKQYIQVGNAVPPFLARQIARALWNVLRHHDRTGARSHRRPAARARLRPAVAAETP